MLGLIRLTALVFAALSLAMTLFALLVFAIRAAPPAAASYAICLDSAMPGPPQTRIRPASTDSVEPYWWSNHPELAGNPLMLNALTSVGIGYWYKSFRPNYNDTDTVTPGNKGLHQSPFTQSLPGVPNNAAGGSVSTRTWDFGTGATKFSQQVDNTSVLGFRTDWRRVQHAWPAGLVKNSVDGNLYVFYQAEMGTCGAATPITCAGSAPSCSAAPYTHMCYFDQWSLNNSGAQLSDPIGGGSGPYGYCWAKEGSRVGLAKSTDDGMTWTDLGPWVNNSLIPMYCPADAANTVSGGMKSPMAVVEGSYVYVVTAMVGGNPAAKTAINNQGILIARISLADLALTGTVADSTYGTVALPVTKINYWDVTTSSWAFNSWSNTSYSTFVSHVHTLNNMTSAGSWYDPAATGGDAWGPTTQKGNFFWPSIHWNTWLGTYVIVTQNFKNQQQYTWPSAMFYFKGASLATDPLNWAPFDTWRDTSGNVVSSSPNNVALLNYTNPSSNYGADYHPKLVGPGGANVGCVGQGAGVDGYETDKCMGQWADLFVRMDFGLISNPPHQYSEAFLSLRFTPNASPLSCNPPPGGAGISRMRGRR